MAKKNLKLTSVKIVDHLFEDFKVSSIRHKFNLQKLANRAVHLYLTDEEFRGYCKGNVVKYTWRETYKNKDEDLQKAEWYLNRLLKEVVTNNES